VLTHSQVPWRAQQMYRTSIGAQTGGLLFALHPCERAEPQVSSGYDPDVPPVDCPTPMRIWLKFCTGQPRMQTGRLLFQRAVRRHHQKQSAWDIARDATTMRRRSMSAGRLPHTGQSGSAISVASLGTNGDVNRLRKSDGASAGDRDNGSAHDIAGDEVLRPSTIYVFRTGVMPVAVY
jgi:hypothetical protein